jgi:hypothetical protein
MAQGHLHLTVHHARPAWDWARWLVIGLAAAGALLFALSFFQAWWDFYLYAPQYPKGLRVTLSLTGASGDIQEVNILNHYIGMKHLDEAAPIERRLAGYGIAAISIVTVLLALVSGRRLNKLVAIPALSLPVVFIADSFYWLYKFGHQLDPKAPLRIKAFTPQMFGNGVIGQFETFAQPALGFWLAVGGAALVLASALIRSRVCKNCQRAGTCGAVCPRLMVLK